MPSTVTPTAYRCCTCTAPRAAGSSRWRSGVADAAARHGVRLIAADRPGMGGSDHQPGRTVLDWPADVRVLADHLGLDRFAVLGYSGGVPFAAATAYRLADR